MSGFRISSEKDSTGISVQIKIEWPEGDFDVRQIQQKAMSVLANAYVELDRRDPANGSDN